jgi:glycosyltransferase involved in cell wall biosynthesis
VRVALIGPVPPSLGGVTPGGVATHQVHLAEGLVARGVDARLLATNASAGSGAKKNTRAVTPFVLNPMPRTDMRFLDRSFRDLGSLRQWAKYLLRVAPMRQMGSRREVLYNLLAYRRFLVDTRPEVVHVQHPLERSTYARLVRRFEGWHTPLVVTAHSLFGEHTEDAIYRQMAPNLRAADRVIAVSEHIADQAVELGVEEHRVRVIRSGVDTERFQPRDRVGARRRLELPAESALVLFVGNLEARKQVDVLLRAMVDVRQHVPSARLLIVGSGESAGVQDQTARLQRLTSELRLSESVRFAGRLPDHGLLDAYAAADVFALPSSSEAQGIVALEAMASGLPVVATAVGGLLGTIEDGQTGYLVPAGDVASLADRLVLVLEDAARREVVASAGREAVRARFTWAHAVDATIEVYHEALACP